MPWADGGLLLRVRHGRGGREAVVAVTRPYAVIGRAPGADVVLDDPAVSAPHAYLHLDGRGLFGVDLASRTGTRIGPARGLAGWLRPGDSLEIAGREIEVVEARLEGPRPDAEIDLDAPSPGPPPSPLDDTGDAPLVRLALHPESGLGPREPLSLNSRLVFVGRSAACAVKVDSPSALRVQCVLVRAEASAFVVDLVGRGTWRNGRPLRGVEPLNDGDALMVGSARFQCRVSAPRVGRPESPPALGAGVGTIAGMPALRDRPGPGLPEAAGMPAAPPLHLIPPEAQGPVLAWLVGQLQARQDEAARRQADLQLELVRLVAEIHRDTHATLARHLERADEIQKQLAELREELGRRFGQGGAAPPPRPLPAGPRLPPLQVAPSAPPEDPAAAADWLIAKVNQLDGENRRGWRDLLGRLTGQAPPPG